MKRIVPCLDVKNGKLTKGVKFEQNVDIGDPVEAAIKYCKDGADEIILYDITATVEGRSIFTDLIKSISKVVTAPLCVGGGIASLDDIARAIDAGAHKCSINSAAVLNPNLLKDGASKFGSKAILAAMDVKRVSLSESIPSGFEVIISGGHKATGLDAIKWAKRCEELGASELCINSIDADGTRYGYDIELTKAIAESVSIPVIASGGAGSLEDILLVLTKGLASTALVASIVHYGDVTIKDIKNYLIDKGCEVNVNS